MDRQSITIEYLNLWFWIDLVSSTPYTWFLAWSEGITLLDMYSSDDNKILSDFGDLPQSSDNSIINSSLNNLISAPSSPS